MTQLHKYPGSKEESRQSFKVNFLDEISSIHRAVREEGATFSTSQMSQSTLLQAVTDVKARPPDNQSFPVPLVCFDTTYYLLRQLYGKI